MQPVCVVVKCQHGKPSTDARSLHRLILLYLWMSDEPKVAPPTRAETNYFLSLFPRPSQMQKEQPEPMDTKDQPKRGIFEDISTREESLPKAMKGETHDGTNSPRELVGTRASASQTPVKAPAGNLPTPTPTTASPASTLTLQQQLLPEGATTTPSGKGKTKKGKQGKGQSKGQKGNSGPSQTTSSSSHQDNVISATGRLCLRHEDAIAVQRANQGYVWWLRTAGPESIVPSLARVSAAWNRKKDEEGVQDHPLRIVMLSTLLEVMIERAQAAVEPSRLEASAQAGLILNQGDEPFWPFLRWNPARRIEEIVSSEEMRPLEHSRLMRKLNQVRDTITPENILRCHGYHSVTEEHDGGHLAPALGNRDCWRGSAESSCMASRDDQLHSMEAYRRTISPRAAGSLSAGQPSCRALGMNSLGSEGEVIPLRSLSSYVAPYHGTIKPSQLVLCQHGGDCFYLAWTHISELCPGRWCLFWMFEGCVWSSESSTYECPSVACSVCQLASGARTTRRSRVQCSFLNLARPRVFSGAWNARLAQGDTIRGD